MAAKAAGPSPVVPEAEVAKVAEVAERGGVWDGVWYSKTLFCGGFYLHVFFENKYLEASTTVFFCQVIFDPFDQSWHTLSPFSWHGSVDKWRVVV